MKLLIIRFSSFGDLVQTSAVLKSLKKQRPDLEIHWLVRSDMKGVIEQRPEVSKIWSLDRTTGITGVLQMAEELKKEKFNFLYDAHASMRSNLISFLLRLSDPTIYFSKRSKQRFNRLLLFKFGVNNFQKPYKSMMTYWEPLKELLHLNGDPEILETSRPTFNFDFTDAILLAPSAAWEMKRWPLENFKKLIKLLPSHKFIVLGGKGDTFCQELEDLDSSRVKNLAGKLSLKESSQLVAHGKLLISADTGLIHVADVYGANGIMLYGPTAFGGTTFPQISTLKTNLNCMPCTKDGRGKCIQDIYQKCMLEITPEMVAKEVERKLATLD